MTIRPPRPHLTKADPTLAGVPAACPPQASGGAEGGGTIFARAKGSRPLDAIAAEEAQAESEYSHSDGAHQ